MVLDLHGFGRDFSDSGAWVPDPLWRPVAGCGALWQPVAESCGPYILQCSVLGACRLAEWCLAGWLDGWMAGWLDGRMARWLDGWMAGWMPEWLAHFSLTRSTPRRVGESGP